MSGCETESRGRKIRDVAGLRSHEVHHAGGFFLEDFSKNPARFGDLIESDEGIHLGKFIHEVARVALGKTAAHDNAGIGAEFVALAVCLQNGIDRFLFRGVDEPAGIDDQDVRFGGVVCDFEALGFCGSEHQLGIDEIFGAAEADHSDTRCLSRWGHCPDCLTHSLCFGGRKVETAEARLAGSEKPPEWPCFLELA